jgi:uncharacterized membrane protein
MYILFRFLHIASAIVFVGGILARQLVRSVASRSEDIQGFAALNKAAGRIENSMVIPGNMAVIVFGVIVALTSGPPILGFLQGASRNWLLVSNLLLLVGIVAVPTVFLPRGKKFATALEQALKEGRFTNELREALDDGVVRFFHSLEIVVILVIVILMVFKPF